MCPNCGDEITGIMMQVMSTGIIYKEGPGEPKADLCSYPELESNPVDAGTMAECMDCYHKAELRDFFPSDEFNQ